MKVPNIIWSYWDTNFIPELIQKCFNTWKKYCPNYEINILNADNIYDYINCSNINKVELSKLNVAKQTDYFRLYLLYHYGGFWLDASIFMNRDLNFVHDYFLNDPELEVFHPIKKKDFGKSYYSWESFFIASPPKTKYIELFLTKIGNVLFHKESYLFFTNYESKKLLIFNDYHMVYAIHNELATNNEHFRIQAQKQKLDSKKIYYNGFFLPHYIHSIFKLIMIHEYNQDNIDMSEYPLYKLCKTKRHLYYSTKNILEKINIKDELKSIEDTLMLL
jgi:hypothetical protein